MVQGKTAMPSLSDGIFWGLMCALMAGAFGLGIAFAFAEIYGAGWLSGGAIGGVVFLIGFTILARSANSGDLPPPNTLAAPRAPAGGAFRAPDAPAAGSVTRHSEPTVSSPPASFADMSQSAGEAIGKAAYSASAAVTSAAQAARDAIAGVLEPAEPGAGAVEPVTPGVEPVRPAALSTPRDGGADDLKRIKGVGPKLEELLHSLGFYHFDQIAAWGPAEVAWVDAHLEGFNGRATRDDWVAQARLLATGEETEFSQRVDKGEVY